MKNPTGLELIGMQCLMTFIKIILTCVCNFIVFAESNNVNSLA